MKIHEVSKLCHVSSSKIRFYEDQGLLHIERDENGYRVFDEGTVLQLKLIVSLKGLDFSLNNIRYILSLYNEPISADCNHRSKAYWQELIEDVEQELKRKLRVLEKLKSIYDLSDSPESFRENRDEIIHHIMEE